VTWARPTRGLFLPTFICRLCAATVRPRDMRCHYCGTLLPALDLQRPFFVVLGLAALLLLIVVLLIAGLAAF
jgi:hypothetical protein